MWSYYSKDLKTSALLASKSIMVDMFVAASVGDAALVDFYLRLGWPKVNIFSNQLPDFQSFSVPPTLSGVCESVSVWVMFQNMTKVNLRFNTRHLYKVRHRKLLLNDLRKFISQERYIRIRSEAPMVWVLSEFSRNTKNILIEMLAKSLETCEFWIIKVVWLKIYYPTAWGFNKSNTETFMVIHLKCWEFISWCSRLPRMADCTSCCLTWPN